MTIANLLLVVSPRGFAVVGQDEASMLEVGLREGFVNTEVADWGAVVEMTRANLRVSKDPVRSITALISDAAGVRSYDDYDLAEKITAPAIGGGTQEVSVESITTTVSAEGYLQDTVELGTQREALVAQQERWMSRTNNGTLKGVSPAITPQMNVASPIESASGAVESLTFATAGDYTISDGDASSPGTLRKGKGYLYAVRVNLNNPSTAAFTVRLSLNGAPFVSVSVGIGQTEVLQHLTLPQLRRVFYEDVVHTDVVGPADATGLSVSGLLAPVGH